MFSLWRKARRENSAASRLLGSTSPRFALHGWQRKKAAEFNARREGIETIMPEDLTRFRNRAMMKAVRRMKGFG
uniref:hypothetical protein n=1 Tax=Thiolapillus sp. TaxID=2017437 RepID=UPI003AF839EC